MRRQRCIAGCIPRSEGPTIPTGATGAAQSLDSRAAWTARDFLVSPDYPRARPQRMVHADASPDGDGFQLSTVSYSSPP